MAASATRFIDDVRFRTLWMALHSNHESFLGGWGGLKKWNVMHRPSKSLDLNPIEHAFHLLKTNLKGKLKTTCKRGLAEPHRGCHPASGDVFVFQTSGCYSRPRVSDQLLKIESLTLDCSFCPMTFGAFKRRRHLHNVV